MTTLLIDGDILKYRCAFAAEKTHYLNEYLGEDFKDEIEHFDNARDAKNKAKEMGNTLTWSRKEIKPVEFALQAAETTIKAILARYPGCSYELFLSPTKCFRDDIAVTKKYKGNRDGAPKPKWIKEVEQYLVNLWGAKFGNNVEADDAIGMAWSRIGGEKSVIVSIDKDLYQLSGRHFNWVENNEYFVSPKAADYRLFTQLICGDLVDNVPGLPGIGEVTARKALEGAQSSRELADRAWNLYRSHIGEGARDYFIEQFRLVYILRGDGGDGLDRFPEEFFKDAESKESKEAVSKSA